VRVDLTGVCVGGVIGDGWQAEYLAASLDSDSEGGACHRTITARPARRASPSPVSRVTHAAEDSGHQLLMAPLPASSADAETRAMRKFEMFLQVRQSQIMPRPV
jgi:hypothetical protein